ARELFLRHALVEGDAPLRANFLKHNREVRAEAQQLAAKTRRRDILPDDESIYRFYRERIPEHVTDVATLERWRREAERENPRLLYMSVEDFIDPDELRGVDSSQFPEQLQLDRTALPLEYRFEPGEPLDGITITVPRDGLATLQQSELDWLVPGLLEEKVLALIRSLPKQVRRNFVPAPDAARRITARLQFGSGPLLPALAAALSADAGERITPDMFRVETLPPHLRMNVRVVDEQGHVIAAGRDVNQLRTELGIASSPSLGASGDERWNRKG